MISDTYDSLGKFVALDEEVEDIPALFGECGPNPEVSSQLLVLEVFLVHLEHQEESEEYRFDQFLYRVWFWILDLCERRLGAYLETKCVLRYQDQMDQDVTDGLPHIRLC